MKNKSDILLAFADEITDKLILSFNRILLVNTLKVDESYEQILA